MIVPAIGGAAGALGTFAGNAAANNAESLASAAKPASLAEPATPATPGAEGAEGAAGVEGLGGLGGSEAAGAAATAGGGAPSFGNALTEAISSLEEGQQGAAAASQALATGKVSDPEAAVTTVEDAALEMQLASQIRTKATEAAQTIFQTQV
jgi:flagellar hook-basal body complex protein FliE